MNRFLVRLGLAGLLVVALLPSLRAADPVELRWQFKKGQVLKYLLKHREVRTVEVGDQKFETTTVSEYDWQWTVTEMDNQGTATLELKLQGLRVTSNGKDFAYRYDSSGANEAAEEFNKNLLHFHDQLRYATYRLRLKTDGRVAEVYGLDKVQAETTAGTSVAETAGYALRDDSFGWYLQLLVGVLPEKPMAEGAKWKIPAPAKLKGLGDLNGQVEFRLGKPATAGDRPCQQLRMDGACTLELDMKWNDAALTGTLKTSKVAGTVLFDAQTGRVRQGEAEVDLAGDLKLGTGDQPLVLKTSFKNKLELETKP
jgi:hypothetical protein